MRGMQGARGMFTRIPGNVIFLTFQGMFKKIPGNVQKDSGECSKRFLGMLKKIPGNVQEDSRECYQRYEGMFQRIPGNPNFDLFLEILLVFYQILLLNCYKTIQKNNY